MLKSYIQRTEIRGPISTPESGIKDVNDNNSDNQKEGQRKGDLP